MFRKSASLLFFLAVAPTGCWFSATDRLEGAPCAEDSACTPPLVCDELIGECVEITNVSDSGSESSSGDATMTAETGSGSLSGGDGDASAPVGDGDGDGDACGRWGRGR